MLAHGADPNAVRQHDNPRRRQPVLFDAIRGGIGGPLPTGNLAVMLKAGADPDIREGEGNSHRRQSWQEDHGVKTSGR